MPQTSLVAAQKAQRGIFGTGQGRDLAVDAATGQEHQRPATHMRTEIAEQPAALRATIDALLPHTARVAALAQQTRQLLFFARGTSDNAADSPLAELADIALVTRAGVERAVPATKTFTCQLAALAVLAVGLGADLDVGLLRGLPALIEELLARTTDPRSGLAEIVAELADVDGLVVSARGLAYSTALELALKIKEACYLHAMGISYADLQHGPIAVVDAATPAIVLAADSGPTLDAAITLARRVTDAGARAYAIGGGAALAAASSRALAGPSVPEWLAPIGLIVPGQLLTEALSRRLGIDPDRPRGLSKITQTS